MAAVIGWQVGADEPHTGDVSRASESTTQASGNAPLSCSHFRSRSVAHIRSSLLPVRLSPLLSFRSSMPLSLLPVHRSPLLLPVRLSPPLPRLSLNVAALSQVFQS
jgi:hypothetical protein